MPGVDDDGWLCSCTIITRPAVDTAGQLHDRMPVTVPSDMVDQWLSPALTDLRQVDDLIAVMPTPTLVPILRSPVG